MQKMYKNVSSAMHIWHKLGFQQQLKHHKSVLQSVHTVYEDLSTRLFLLGQQSNMSNFLTRILSALIEHRYESVCLRLLSLTSLAARVRWSVMLARGVSGKCVDKCSLTARMSQPKYGALAGARSPGRSTPRPAVDTGKAGCRRRESRIDFCSFKQHFTAAIYN